MGYSSQVSIHTDSLDRKESFNLLSSARLYDVKRWHDKYDNHTIQVNTPLTAFTQDLAWHKIVEGRQKSRK